MAVWRSDGNSNDNISDSSCFDFIAAHVDDMLCGGPRSSVDRVKAILKEKFDVRDMGPASVFIGLRISRDRERRIIYIDQGHYGRDILDLYGMAECNPCLVPMNPTDQALTKALEGECISDAEKKNYQAIVGSLGYVMNCSRPDLAFAVNKLAQFSSAPVQQHVIAVKRILRYLRSTLDAQLTIGAESTLPLTIIRGWFDASWADNIDDRRSTYGYTILYGYTALVWKSRKHKGVTLSTTDAEYLAATEITRDLYFIQNIFTELHLLFAM